MMGRCCCSSAVRSVENRHLFFINNGWVGEFSGAAQHHHYLWKEKMGDKVKLQRETCLLGILSTLVTGLCWVSAKKDANSYHPASRGVNLRSHAPGSDSSNDNSNVGSWQEQTAPSQLPVSPVSASTSWDDFALASRYSKLKGTDSLTSIRIMLNILYLILMFK